MTTSYDAYMTAKRNFLNKHHNDFEIQTGTLDEYDSYHKEYICSDGAIWYEIMNPVWEKATAEVRGIKFETEVKLLRTEYFNSDDAKSRYYYEKYWTRRTKQ